MSHRLRRLLGSRRARTVPIVVSMEAYHPDSSPSGGRKASSAAFPSSPAGPAPPAAGRPEQSAEQQDPEQAATDRLSCMEQNRTGGPVGSQALPAAPLRVARIRCGNELPSVARLVPLLEALLELVLSHGRRPAFRIREGKTFQIRA